MPQPDLKDIRVAVVGLGYVGLPLAVYMARHYPTVGFDIDSRRVQELSGGVDRTGEVSAEEFSAAKTIKFSCDAADLEDCNFIVVTVPTPVDETNTPDLSALVAASRTIGGTLKEGDIVVFESTVYPGATEEVCVPELENSSGLKFNSDFYAGYSPERINPGDAKHRLPDIMKVTSGSTPEVADLVDTVYAKVITAGTRKAGSIRAAEAAKVIENIQRDVNIALVNEFAMLFKKMDLDTLEVLSLAGTKWNFHPYRPGLVGGHCIGVDPYYLTHKAKSIGFNPEMILAGRRINDGMAAYVSEDILQKLKARGLDAKDARLLVLGFTFKENCPDTRNTKIADLVRELAGQVGQVQVYDPLADPEEAQREYGIEITNSLPSGPFDSLVLAVAHSQFSEMGEDKLEQLLGPNGLIYDIKGVLPREMSDGRL